MRRSRGISPLAAGLIALTLIGVGGYLGFTKRLPWHHDYVVHGVFASANELHRNSPVRIAGVNVGRVTGVKRGPAGTAVVAMAISDSGRPIHADATMKVRPRIFLEGNFFVDVRPGTGAAPELHDGGTVPLAQTATPVQFDQVLSTLNSSTRDQLRTLVEQYGAALDHGGAQAIRRGVPNWTGAFKGAAIVAEASRGTQEHDLSRFIAAQAQVSGALASRRTQLADLVVQFNHTLGALAARQGDVAASVAGLAGTLRAAGPALAEVNRALPSLRAFIPEVRPGLRAAPRTLDLALPLLDQANRLLAPSELPTLIASLRPAVRSLTAIEPDLRTLLGLVKPVTDCVHDNAVPALTTPLDDGGLSTGQPAWQELLHNVVGLASGSQDFDGNGPAVRYYGGYGDQLVSTGALPGTGQLYGLSSTPVLGSRPAWPGPGNQPPFRPDVACATQRAPDLNPATRSAPAPRTARARTVDPKLLSTVARVLRAADRGRAAR